MQKTFGYCRVSTAKQNIERQERNILAAYPSAKIYKEKYTGTKFVGRSEFNKILKQVQPGDTIVFDSVSRMSRNSAEGIELYMDLYKKGIELVFLKEPHINTATYKQAINNTVDLVGNDIADIYIKATNEVLKLLAVRQIELAFGQSEKEVLDLHQRTSEGIETARLNGKQIGQRPGNKLHVKKEAPAKELILKYSKAFNGSNTDEECMKLIRIARNTYYNIRKS